MGILLTESEAAAAGSGTSMIVMLLVYAVLIGAMWFFFMRPQKKEQKRVAAMLSNLEMSCLPEILQSLYPSSVKGERDAGYASLCTPQSVFL